MTKRTEKSSNFREYLEALIIAGIILGFSNTFVVKTFFIPSASMEETLLIGDHLFVNRFIYGPTQTRLEEKLLPHRGVRRGDVVIFRSPERPTVDMVKRCIGIEGDTIEVRDKDLYINGKWVDDSAYTQHTDSRVIQRQAAGSSQASRRDNFGPYLVPDDHYFCLGDNRDQSYDSRFWGPVAKDQVKGRAFLVYWSYGGQTSDGTWKGLPAKVGQLIKTAAGFVTKTRWLRTFHLVR
jgi:signal peptidase I